MAGNDYLLNRLNEVRNIPYQQQPTVPQMQQGNNYPINPSQNIGVGTIRDKYEIKTEVTAKLNERMSKVKEDPDDNFLRTTIMNLLMEYNLTEIERQNILTEIMYDIKGYGILQPLLDDPEITEILVCQYDNIWVEKFGKLIKTNVRFASEEELRKLIDKIVQPLGRRIDDNQPMVNARLKDKSRVNAVIPSIAADGATLSIRKFSRKVFTVEDYLKFGTMTEEMAEFIRWCVTGRKNIIVSGGTGSGKTTLLNFLSQFIPENEAIITIEDLLELQLVQPCVRRLEARGKNAEGKGEITIRDLVVNALRMRPDRIIVGEVRSHEVIDMLQAMNTGHDGSLSTVHANSPKDLIERLYVMYLMGGLDVPEKAVKTQIANAIDIVVQIQRMADGSRKITRISEIVGCGKAGAEINNEYVKKKKLDERFMIKNPSSTEVYIQDIYKYDEINKKFVTTGWIPTFLDEFIAKGYPLSESMFRGGE